MEALWRRSLRLCVCLIFVLLAVLPVRANNMLTNLAGWSVFSHTDGQNGYRVGIDPDTPWNDKPSACFKATKADQKPSEFYVLVWQDFDAKKFLGKRVEFSGFVKTKDADGWATAVAKVWQGDKVVEFDNMDDRRISRSDQWRKFSVVLDVPEKSDKISVGFYFTGGGEAWLNGLSFKAVERTVKTTAMKWDAKKYAAYFWNKPTYEPENMDLALTSPEEISGRIHKWAAYTTGTDENEYKIFVDRKTQFKQKPSICIQARDGDAPGFALCYQDLSATNYLDKRIRLSADVKTKDVKDWSALFTRIQGQNALLAFDNMERRPIKDTRDWQEHA